MSGGHVNTVVSAVDWWIGRRTRTGLSPAELVAYAAAQTGGAILGAVLADLMFGLPPAAWSKSQRGVEPGVEPIEYGSCVVFTGVG